MASSITGGALTGSSGSSSSTSTAYGLGQGIDVNQFVQLALTFDNARITSLQNSQSALYTQSGALSQLTSEIGAVQGAAQALSDPLGTLTGMTASVSDSSVLSASATSSASAATHTITVNSLATTSSAYSDAVPASDTAISGSLSIQVGSGTAVTVPVDAAHGTSTLAGLVSYINGQSNTGVTASIVKDSNGARLALLSHASGAPGDLTVNGTLSFTGTNSQVASASFHQGVQGKNASLTVDGIPISSATNTVSNAISGVTLSLNSADPNSQVNVAVGADTQNATNAINAFVSAYNTAIKDINAQFAVLSDGSGGGPLEADGSVRQAQSMLLGAIAYSIGGNNGIVNLSSMGVNLNNDGTLSVDNATLTDALTNNYSAVQAFFQTTTTGFGANFSNVMNSLVGPGNGVLTVDSQGLSQTTRDLSQQISDLQTALAVKQQNLVQVYAQVNATLQELPLLQAQMSQQLGSLA
ncbi:MAG TPA: flagellar filament capping protein FliD [Dongiaceae bacterium]|nr:flagellar filament capping protein FliD [Dongiaceae bacterium]